YPAELQAPGRLLSTIAPGRASRVRFAHVLRTLRARPGPPLARTAGPVLETGPGRSSDRLAAAAVAHLVGTVGGRRRRAPVVDAGGVLAGRVADPLGRLRDQRLRRPLAGRQRGTHPGPAAGHRRGARARGAGAVRGADAGGVRAGVDLEPADGADELRRRGAGGELPVPEALHLPAAGVPGHVVRLGHPDGFCRGAGYGAGSGL